MGMKLFCGSDGSDDDDADAGDLSKIQVNKEFARRYEHNKKREDLQRLQDLKKKGVVHDSDGDSSSSDESLDDDLMDSKKDLEFLNALIRVKNQDPALKNKDAKLFESDSDDEDEEEQDKGKRRKKEKPLYLKDVAAKHLIEEGPEFEDKDEGLRLKSYSEEQEELRKAFLNAAEEAMDGDDGDDGDLLKEKESKVKAVEDDDDGEEIQRKLDEYFGKDDNLDENEMFLKKYFMNKMWVDDSKDEKPLDEGGFDLSEDEKELERQEDYERGYNFRFEENAGDRVLGHSRIVEGSVRKKTNARKLQRKSKEERMAQAEFERKEELKHLKNLKRKEMNEKLRKIRETAGIGDEVACLLDEDDLEEDFDPEDYDRKMREAFNDDYYGADDIDPEFGSDSEEDGELQKPDFDKEDELLGLPEGWDEVSGDGFLAARERTLKRRADSEDNDEQVEVEEEAVPAEVKREKKGKMSSLEKEVLEKELEEFYKLDYEDTIGDLKTRFKYREVGSKKYGLSTEEILMLDDKELNQYVSLKKMAPYREKEWKVPRVKKYNQKLRNKLILQGEKLDSQATGKKSSKIHGKGFSRAADTNENAEARAEASNDDTSNLSRKSRRKRSQAELKLSQSRLLAYGKIPSKTKSKKKQH